MSSAEFSTATWRTSSYSTAASNCVEIAVAPHAIGVRDSKNSAGGTLTFTVPRWRAFLR